MSELNARPLIADHRINYLNKALELFNTSMVVPVYFCYFTSATMITSFILYRGLKASAPTLITMVLGFLVTCFGITILQMSKVDPTKLQGLDRRSTILLQAARQHTEADEKGDLKAMEDPGMDALRGGFGSVGSIIRARSIQRRRSTLSSQASHGFSNSAYTGGTHMHHMSTQGLAHLPRYQLNDAPMHDDPETISLAPQQTGSSAGAGGVGRSRSSTLKFDDQDTVHQYGYGGPSVHSHVSHEELRSPTHQTSADRISLPTITELSPAPTPGATLSPGQAQRAPSHASQKTALSHASDEKLDPAEHGDSTHLWQLFGFGHGHRDSQSDKRGGPARGVRDYPRTKEAADEREERRGLVASPVQSPLNSPEEDPLARFEGQPMGRQDSRESDEFPHLHLQEVDIAAPRPISLDDGRCSPTSGRIRPTGPR